MKYTVELGGSGLKATAQRGYVWLVPVFPLPGLGLLRGATNHVGSNPGWSDLQKTEKP